jgi:outer membrane protein OmpA-like peptidoglycan-associated protein
MFNSVISTTIYTTLLIIACNGCSHHSVNTLPSFKSQPVLSTLNLEGIQAKLEQARAGNFGQFVIEMQQTSNYLTQAQQIYEQLHTQQINDNVAKDYFIQGYLAANKALVHRNNAELALEQLVSPLDQRIAEQNQRLSYLEALHIKPGTVIPIKNIYFDSGSSHFNSSEQPKIEELIDFLRQHPIFALKLMSHANTLGSKNYNIRLANRRNQSVLKELQRQGLPLTTIVTTVAGEITGADETDNPNNRRVEIKPYVHGNYKYAKSK